MKPECDRSPGWVIDHPCDRSLHLIQIGHMKVSNVFFFYFFYTNKFFFSLSWTTIFELSCILYWKKIRKYSRSTHFFNQTKPAKIKYSRDDIAWGGSPFFIFLLILMWSVWILVHVGLQVRNKSDRWHELTRSSSICSVCPLSPRQVIEGLARGYFLFFLRQDCTTQLLFSEHVDPIGIWDPMLYWLQFASGGRVLGIHFN